VGARWRCIACALIFRAMHSRQTSAVVGGSMSFRPPTALEVSVDAR